MSLLGSSDDLTEERQIASQAAERTGICEEAQLAGADQNDTQSIIVNSDFEARTDQADASDTPAMEILEANQPRVSQAGESAYTRLGTVMNTSLDEVDALSLQGVQPHRRHTPLATATTIGTPLRPDPDGSMNGSSSDIAYDEGRQTKPYSESSTLQSSQRTATSASIGKTTNLVLSEQHGVNTTAELAIPSKVKEDGMRSDIQNIMEQFNEQASILENDDFDSRENKAARDALSIPLEHPPRSSSLDGRAMQDPTLVSTLSNSHLPTTSPRPPLTGESLGLEKWRDSTSLPKNGPICASSTHPDQSLGNPPSPKTSMSLHKVLPPAPDPEPDLPFDFHRFLDQLRHRTADPVAKFLRSFLVEFGKKQWMVHEQVKIISDFQLFITTKMAQCEVWRDISDAEFDNAKEGMEKLVMNRLYTQTFSPAIPPPIPINNVKGKSRTSEKSIALGRRGQHQEDIERDDVLAQKVQIYGWVKEEQLDIPPVGERGTRFLNLARQELIKIKSYRAPRDKVICILNCCKVIFGLLRDSKSGDTSADSFIPLLILVVLQANPDHLVSNVQYIMRFRNQDKLAGEAGYYLSSLTGAIQFIENLDRTALTVTDAVFEANVEAAVSAIAERHGEEQPLNNPNIIRSPSAMFNTLSEKAEPSRPALSPLNSLDTGRRPRHSTDGFNGSEDASEENAAVAGLLRTIKKPLSSIGRIFSEDANTQGSLHPQLQQHMPPQEIQTKAPLETTRNLSPAVIHPPRSTLRQGQKSHDGEDEEGPQSPPYGPSEAAIRQASAEAAEASRIQRLEYKDVVETLAGMFPSLDRDVIDDVVREKQGRVGSAVDACLALSS